MENLTEVGLVPPAMNTDQNPSDPISLKPVGEPPRFLVYQWLRIGRAFVDST